MHNLPRCPPTTAVVDARLPPWTEDYSGLKECYSAGVVRDRIVIAATRTFAREGALGSRLEDIRRDAGVSVGAIYHHFADKEALHAEAWMRALGSYQAGFVEVLRASSDAEQGVREVVEHQLCWVVAHREAAMLLYSGRPGGEAADERLAAQNRAFFSEIMRWWRVHVSYGALRDLEPELLHALWLGPAEVYCRQWVLSEQDEMPVECVSALADAAWGIVKGGLSK
jgi:AcrR family transcriptional regulator